MIPPLQGFGWNELRKLVGSSGNRLGAEVDEALAHRGIGDSAGELGMEARDDRLWGAAWRKQGEPTRGFIVAQAGLGACRHVRQRRQARLAGDRERAGVLGAKRRHDVGQELKAERHRARHQVGYILGDVAIRHMG